MKTSIASFIAAILLHSIWGGVAVLRADTPFTYFLGHAAQTSAGVYSNGTLLRTLWFNEPKNAGANTAVWDNLDDEGKPVPSGAYELRVLVHNMKYQWD